MIRAATCAVVMLALLGTTTVRGQPDGGFAEAFDAAQANDAEYRAARFELQSREQVAPIARASLLPSVSASYSKSRVHGDREVPNALGQDFSQDLDYRNPVAALQLRAPVLNLDAVRRYRSARSQVDGARSLFMIRGQELLERLGTAYLQRLFAEEVVALAQAQVDALKAQGDMAARRYTGGEGTRTEVGDAAASLSLARVQLIEALDQREVAQRTLTGITGMETPPQRGLPQNTTQQPLPHNELQDWIDLAHARNPNLQARHHLLESVRYEAERARAGHYPRIDVIASAVDSRNESVVTLNQHTRQYSAGVQVNIPIYSGGGVQASVMQALAELARAQAQLDGDRQKLAIDVRQQYQLTLSGRGKVEALQEAVAASTVALQGTQQGLTAGARTTADVLDATRRVFEARRDLAQSRYDLLLARLRLQALAGLPLLDIVQDVDRHLMAPAAAVALEGFTAHLRVRSTQAVTADSEHR